MRSALPTMASSGPRPMAASTWLGSTAPLEQAAPAEAAMPAWSSRMTAASASTSAKRRWRMPATRRARSPDSTVPGTAASEPVGQPVAQRGHPVDRSPAPGHGGGQGGGHAHSPGHVRGPAAPTPLLAAAVDAGPDPAHRPDDQGTAALRTAELVGADRHQPGSCGAGTRRRATARPGRRRCAGPHRATGDATTAGHLVERLDRADLVVDGHDRHQAHVVPAGVGQGVEVDPAVGSARHLAQLRARAGGQGPAGPQHGVVLHGRAHHGRGAGCVHPSATASHPPWTARSSASVPPEVRTTSPGPTPSSSAIRSRASSRAIRARLDSAWAPDGLANPSVRTGSMASSASGRSGVVAAWSR